MNPNGIVFLLLAILGGVPIVILFYYGAQVALHFVKRPAPPTQVPEGGRTTAARIAYGPPASGLDRLCVEGAQPAVIRILPSHESGLPYASRSG